MIGWRNILLIIIAYLVLRFVARVWKFRSIIVKQREAFQQQARANNHQHRQEGEVNVIKDGNKKKKDLNEGSYVDFEEVD